MQKSYNYLIFIFCSNFLKNYTWNNIIILRCNTFYTKNISKLIYYLLIDKNYIVVVPIQVQG